MRLTLVTALALACDNTPRADLEHVWLFDVGSPDPHVCVPPSAGPSPTVYVVGTDAFTVSAILAEWTGSVRGLVVGDGVEVAAWSLDPMDAEPDEELATTRTDDDGRFSLTLPGRGSVGLLLDGEHWVYPNISRRPDPEGDGGGDLLCVYWADEDGMQISSAGQGTVVQLVVRARSAYEAPSLTIDEVGNDLGGNQRVDTFEGEPFVDGVSRTPWTVGAEWAPLEGNESELAFGAWATHTATGEEHNMGSEWLVVP